MGSLSFSMEIELGWGTTLGDRVSVEQITNKFSDCERSRETETLKNLLDVCDSGGIPIGFDVVGHLFLSECNGHESPHNSTWFDIDPETDVDTDPLFFAPDLVEMILMSNTQHEIGTHTFSHIPCDEVSPHIVNWELNKIADIHESSGLNPPTFFVAPRHRDPPWEILKENNIHVVRSPSDDENSQDRGAVSRFLGHFTKDPILREPELHEGLTLIWCQSGASLTAFYLPKGDLSPHPAFQAVPKSLRKRAHQSYLQQALEAAKNGKTVHMWAHLYDISNKDQWSIVKSFLEDVSHAKKRGEVEVVTPTEVANNLNG